MGKDETTYFDKEAESQLIVEEQRKIAAHRLRDENGECWTGLALSGGGIRSAIFCLGALQALAAKNLLGCFDYMSSVSGGGYIASSLLWCWKQDPLSGVTAQNFPFGTSLHLNSGDEPKDKRLAFLRWHGRYLTPGEGMTIWSAVSVILRTIFLNLVVWVPMGACALTLCIVFFKLMEPISLTHSFPNALFGVVPGDWNGECDPRHVCKLPLSLFFSVCLWLAFVVIAWFALWAIAFSFDTRISPKKDNQPSRPWYSRPNIYILIAGCFLLFIGGMLLEGGVIKTDNKQPAFIFVSATLLTLGLIAFVVWILQIRRARLSANYIWRRKYEIAAGKYFVRTMLLLTVGSLPILPYLLINYSSLIINIVSASAALLSGVISGLLGHQVQSQKTVPGNFKRLFLAVASAIFIYSIGIVSYLGAQALVSTPDLVGDDVIIQNAVRGGVMALIALSVLLGWFTNVNYVGLHRFYRDRLMEAFMPDSESIARNEVKYAAGADRLSLTELWPQTEEQQTLSQRRALPYPILNTNAILINDQDRKIAWRGGDNFIFSPLYVGSKATGWERTSTHISKHGPLTLPSAMAASGAAANANSAYVGTGITRDRLLSIVMMLLNVRLGLWVGSPSKKETRSRSREPNHFVPSFRYGILGKGYRSDSPFMELSDGGHFDNLGIYELIRRRLDFILVLDGEADPTTSMPALFSVAQRVNEDFGAVIDLSNQMDVLVPKEAIGFPEKARYVDSPYFVAPITYKSPKKIGRLVYVKLAMMQQASFIARGYKAQNPDFPHQPTLNQFFVPEQVEAYRELGYRNMTFAIEDRIKLKEKPF